ncbi:MAG: AAA family ATPase, partial [Anaerolineales bacterium]
MRLADRLNAARRRFFVGRAAEQSLFHSALTAAEWPFQVLYLFGPGGVGKTSLLNEYLRQTRDTHIPALYLDARNIEATPEAVLNALRSGFTLRPTDSPLAHLAAQSGRHILLIDTCENLTPLEGWLNASFLPELPSTVLVVMASREPPPELWRTDPGWQALAR